MNKFDHAGVAAGLELRRRRIDGHMRQFDAHRVELNRRLERFADIVRHWAGLGPVPVVVVRRRTEGEGKAEAESFIYSNAA